MLHTCSRSGSRSVTRKVSLRMLMMLIVGDISMDVLLDVVYSKEMCFVKLQDAESNFRTLLVEMVRGSDPKWADWWPRLQKDVQVITPSTRPRLPTTHLGEGFSCLPQASLSRVTQPIRRLRLEPCVGTVSPRLVIKIRLVIIHGAISFRSSCLSEEQTPRVRGECIYCTNVGLSVCRIPYEGSLTSKKRWISRKVPR